MNAAAETFCAAPPASSGPSAARAWAVAERSQRQFRWRVLLQVALCGVPAVVLFGAGQHVLAGHYFWGVLAVMMARLVLRKQPNELLCVLLGLVPLMNMLRGLGFALYNSIVVAFAFALIFYGICFPRTWRDLIERNRMVLVPSLFVVVYYVASVVTAQSYSANLRMFDCLFAMLAVVIVARRAHRLKTVLLGLMFSACAVALCFVQYLQSGSGDRMGSLSVQGMAVGNPVAIGTPLALGFLALVVDRGYWLQWRKHLGWRIGWLLPTTMLLGLSTSRAAWGVACVGVLVSLLLGRRQRLKIVLILLLGAVGLKLVLLSPYGLTLQKAMDRTFESDRSAANRTSGRSDQWLVFSRAFTDSAVHLLVGHGPGNSSGLYAEYAEQVNGVRQGEWALHSLFMQIGAELGLLGLLPMVLWMGVATVKAWRWSRARGLLLPLVCFFSYVLIVLTVSGNDTVSGTFLGLGLLPTVRWTERRPELDPFVPNEASPQTSSTHE
jgi:O-antigen ligase